jgi:hypothetical protein
MKTVLPSAEHVEKNAASGTTRVSRNQQAPAPSGGLAQLATQVNSAAQPQSLAQLQESARQSSCVSSLAGLAAEINQQAPAPLRGVPVNDPPASEREAGGTENAVKPENPVQRVIGNAGAANTGRMVHDRDYVLAKIKGITPPSYMGTPWPVAPVIYNVSFVNNNETGFALGQDPNYWLVEKEKEPEFTKDHGKRAAKLIPLRSPVLQGLANGTFILNQEAGTIKPGEGGDYEDGNYPFVILADGSLSISPAQAGGHTGLSKGGAVLMAGELTIQSAKATYRSCRTGHYYTRPEEEKRGLEIMKARYSWIGDLSPKGPEAKDAPKGLAIFGLVTPGTSTLKMEENFEAAKKLWDVHKAIWVVDVSMHTMVKTILEHKKIMNEADGPIDKKTSAALVRQVEITGEILQDIKAAIEEDKQGIGRDVPRPAGLKGYDGTNPFANDDL